MRPRCEERSETLCRSASTLLDFVDDTGAMSSETELLHPHPQSPSADFGDEKAAAVLTDDAITAKGSGRVAFIRMLRILASVGILAGFAERPKHLLHPFNLFSLG
jgi:hypothetical protein